MPTGNLLRGDLAGEIPLLVAMLAPRPLLMLILGQNQTVLLTGLLFSFILQNHLTNHLFSCLMRDQEPEQIRVGSSCAVPSQGKSGRSFKSASPSFGQLPIPDLDLGSSI